tara:strand:+ start:69 stop:1418 length:1350 start_codon:yes stop_codon:yes gene_type:complete
MNPNILFILIDGARADQIFNPKKKSKMPNIDSLIKKGISFTNCFSSVDGTTISLNCIFNSLYPTKTGLRAKTLILKNNNFLNQLKENGYHIFGYIPKVSCFDPMIELFENSNNTFYAGPPPKHVSETKKEILKILDSIKLKKPWFYFIHLVDMNALRVKSEPDGIPEFLDKKFGDTPYDRMMSSIDYGIGKILEKIELEETIVVITSDHGSLVPFENLDFTDFEPSFERELSIGKKLMPKSTHKAGGKIFSTVRNLVRESRLKKAAKGLSSYEQRSRLPYFKQSLYDENIRVPLIISGPKILPRKISFLMSNMDIFPTIFDILGLETNKEKIDGRSLKPILDNQELKEKPIFLHTMPHEKIEKDDAVGIRTTKYKFIRSASNPKKNRYLYNLELDKFENINIIENNTDVVKKLETTLEDIKSSSIEETEYISEEETKKIEAELKKLGYM